MDAFIKKITNTRERGFNDLEDEDWEYILNYVENQKKFKKIKAKKYRKTREKNEELQSDLEDREQEVRGYQKSIPDIYDIAYPMDIESVVDELEEQIADLKREIKYTRDQRDHWEKEAKNGSPETKKIMKMLGNVGKGYKPVANRTNLPAGRFTEC